MLRHCFQWFKDTKMKANHNIRGLRSLQRYTVSNGSKILKWKQITTYGFSHVCPVNCFQWFKDTKMKANHNEYNGGYLRTTTVSNGSKILKWKQITTYTSDRYSAINCFQWFKDTKMKANHNLWCVTLERIRTVSNGSKILKWKQITTSDGYRNLFGYCFQWFKDTKMKANHNDFSHWDQRKKLFPMVQRY